MTTTTLHTMFLVLVAVVVVCLYVPGIYALRPQTSHQSRLFMSTRNRHNSLLPAVINPITTATSSRRNHHHIFMAARSGGGGSTKIDRKTSQQTSTKPSYREEIEKDWRLILHDDTVHTIQQVCEILTACCPLCAGPRAYEVTLEVHMTGAGTVAVANKKIVDEYCKSLQTAGLSVSVSPDDDFEGEGDEGEGE